MEEESTIDRELRGLRFRCADLCCLKLNLKSVGSNFVKLGLGSWPRGFRSAFALCWWYFSSARPRSLVVSRIAVAMCAGATAFRGLRAKIMPIGTSWRPEYIFRFGAVPGASLPFSGVGFIPGVLASSRWPPCAFLQSFMSVPDFHRFC